MLHVLDAPHAPRALYVLWALHVVHARLVAPSSRRAPPRHRGPLLPVGLVDDEVTPGDVLKRSLLEVGHLVRRDQLAGTGGGERGVTEEKDAK